VNWAVEGGGGQEEASREPKEYPQRRTGTGVGDEEVGEGEGRRGRRTECSIVRKSSTSVEPL